MKLHPESTGLRFLCRGRTHHYVLAGCAKRRCYNCTIYNMVYCCTSRASLHTLACSGSTRQTLHALCARMSVDDFCRHAYWDGSRLNFPSVWMTSTPRPSSSTARFTLFFSFRVVFQSRRKEETWRAAYARVENTKDKKSWNTKIF